MESAIPSPVLQREIRRNTVLLGACLTLIWAVIQLQAALATVTFTALTGLESLAGVSTAVFLVGVATATVPTGRLMDARGRGTGLLGGFLVGLAGTIVTWLGVSNHLAGVFLAGLALVGAGVGAVGLARTGAADMYPPERRAQGISRVLVGAAFGAIVGPIAFAPLLRGVRDDPAGLAVPWLVAAAMFALGVVVVRLIRLDPIEIGRRLGLPDEAADSAAEAAAAIALSGPSETPSRSVRRVLEEDQAAGGALLVAIAAQAVMTTTMSVIGLVLVHHGHDLAAVSIALSAHFLGMFGLVLVAGQIVDRIGRQRSMTLGLVILAGGVLGLLAGTELDLVLPAMFGVGVGWNIAYVAATATLADASRPEERGRVMAAMDFSAIGMASLGSILGTAVLGQSGLPLLVAVSAVVAVLPIPVLRAAGSIRGMRSVQRVEL